MITSKVFVPREVAPTADERWWKTSENPCIPIYNGTVLPNCVGYAHGRFSEILGYFHPDLPACDAGKWLDVIKAKSTKLKWGTVPKLGAVAVWKKKGKAGHVAIVEYINEDGTIMLSESGYGCAWNFRFWTEGPRSGPNWYKTSDYEFQGFIYNPGTEDVTEVVPWKQGTPWGTVIDDSVKYSTDVLSSDTKSTSTTKSASISTVVTPTAIQISEPVTAVTSSPVKVPVTGDQSPKEHPAKLFINSIISHMGSDDHKWVVDSTSIVSTQGWSAATLCAAAKYCKFEKKIIPIDKYAAEDFMKSLVHDSGGKYVSSNTSNPQIGDIFAVLTQKSSNINQWSANRVGVVRNVQGDTVLTIEGDLNGKIQLNRRKSKDIRYYVRPDWTKIGGTETVLSTSLYTTRSTNADATLREVAYLNKLYEPSITLSDIKLSAINYTSLLSDLYDATNDYLINSGYQTSNANTTCASYQYQESKTFVDYSNLESENAKIIFRYLLDNGYTSSIACGFLANIKVDSNYNPASVRGLVCGLLNNTGTRKSRMISMCPDWRNNITGQVDHLIYELNYDDKQTLIQLSNIVSDTLESAKQSARIVAKYYENKTDSEISSIDQVVSTIWLQLVVSTDSTGNVNIITESENELITGETISIPVSAQQTGMSTNHDVYTYLLSRFKDSSKQKQIFESWVERGRTYMYRIATLNDYFLICVTPVFGDVGDIVSIVLDDGSYFNAIIADVDASTKNTWGFNSSSGTHIIKWMSAPLEFSTSELLQGIQQSGWLGRKVVKIVNYGSWIDR